MVLLNNRDTLKSFEVYGIVKEFLRHIIFFPPARLPKMVDAFDRDEAVKASERRGEGFAVLLPLGRPWHEMSFIDVIESGWPIFHYLDFTARFVAELPQLYDGEHAIRRPAPPCKLAVEADSGEVSLRMLPTLMRKTG